MRGFSWLLASFVLGAILGCGETPSNLTVKPAPTGGALVRLPGNHGFVAIKTENPNAAQGSKGKNRPTSIVAYFYQPDGQTLMSPAPADVVFKLGDNDSTKAVTLTPDSKDPNRFASAPGPYSRGIQGKIQAKINGESIEESFSSL